MRPLALLLSVSLAAAPAWAEPRPEQRAGRGLLTGVGFTLLVTGATSLGLGIAGTVAANDASARVQSYASSMLAFDASAVAALRARVDDSTRTAVIGFTAGVVLLAGGLLCLAIDTPPARVAFVPTSGGGALVFSGRF
jgi:hypothetical protein